jgi:hypothetical protein
MLEWVMSAVWFLLYLVVVGLIAMVAAGSFYVVRGLITRDWGPQEFEVEQLDPVEVPENYHGHSNGVRHAHDGGLEPHKHPITDLRSSVYGMNDIFDRRYR